MGFYPVASTVLTQELRFDFGGIAAKKKQILPDGRILCPGSFARDGVLAYRQRDGRVIRELRLPETNQDSLTMTSYGASPITLDHPSVLVDKSNAKDLAVGFSDRQVVYEDGFLQGIVMIHDGIAIDRVDRGKIQLSPGYYCDVEDSPGTWRGERYDRIQRNVRTNHIAIVDIGRNGPEVRLHWDSAGGSGLYALVQEVDPTEQRSYFDFGQAKRLDTGKGTTMTTEMRSINLDGVTTFEVPADLAQQISKMRADMDETRSKLVKAEDKVAQMSEEVAAAEEEAEEMKERADAAMAILKQADTTLKAEGYVVDSEGVYHRTDATHGVSGPKSVAAPDAAAGEEQEDAHTKAHVTKGGEAKMDGLEPRLEAWVTAEKLVPGIREKKFDSALDVTGIQRLTIDSLRPGLVYKDSEVEGLYRALTEGFGVRGDAASHHADNLSDAVRASANAAAQRQDTAVTHTLPVLDEAYLAPLAMSRP